MKQGYTAAKPRHKDTAEFARQIAARINAEAALVSSQWRSPQGTTTRHFMVDDLRFRERKKTFAKLETIDPIIATVTDAFHEQDVLNAVVGVTGIEGLEADPELYAGGISMMGKGDFLNPHIDNSHDAPRRRYRRLNLLYYISPEWQDDFGGNFELWDSKVSRPKMITSRYNRLVVMETIGFHGTRSIPCRSTGTGAASATTIFRRVRRNRATTITSHHSSAGRTRPWPGCGAASTTSCGSGSPST